MASQTAADEPALPDPQNSLLRVNLENSADRAAEVIDFQVLNGKPWKLNNDKELANLRQKRVEYATEHADYPNLYLYGEVAKVRVRSSYVTPTSTAVRVASKVKVHMQSTLWELNLEIPMEIAPYVLDRIVHFYYDYTLPMPKEKTYKFAKTRPHATELPDPNRMTELTIITEVYLKSSELKDGTLGRTALAKLGKHMCQSFLNFNDLLNNLDYFYRMPPAGMESQYAKLRRVLLGGLMRKRVKGMDMTARQAVESLQESNPAFHYDYSFACEYLTAKYEYESSEFRSSPSVAEELKQSVHKVVSSTTDARAARARKMYSAEAETDIQEKKAYEAKMEKRALRRREEQA